MAVDSSGERVYVAAVGMLFVIDTADNTIAASIPVPFSGAPGAIANAPAGIVVHPSGERVYAAYARLFENGFTDDGELVVVDTASQTILATRFLDPPYAVSVDPAGLFVYVTSNSFQSGGRVSAFDTATDAFASGKRLALGSVPAVAGVAVAPDGARLYVAGAHAVFVLDLETGDLVDMIRVGATPLGISVTADSTRALVANFSDDTVSAIDTDSGSVIATVPVGRAPVALGQFIGPAVIGTSPTPTSTVPPPTPSPTPTATTAATATASPTAAPPTASVTATRTSAPAQSTTGDGCMLTPHRGASRLLLPVLTLLWVLRLCVGRVTSLRRWRLACPKSG